MMEKFLLKKCIFEKIFVSIKKKNSSLQKGARSNYSASGKGSSTKQVISSFDTKQAHLQFACSDWLKNVTSFRPIKTLQICHDN